MPYDIRVSGVEKLRKRILQKQILFPSYFPEVKRSDALRDDREEAAAESGRSCTIVVVQSLIFKGIPRLTRF